MTVFSREELMAVYKTAKDLKTSQPQGISSNDYLQSVLMDKIGNLSQTEAKEIIDRMETTIRDYNINYNRGLETGSVPAEDMLKDAINSKVMNDQEAINYLATTIVVMRSFGKDLNGLTDEVLRVQAEEVIGGREANNATVEAMIKEAAEAIRTSDLIAIDEQTIGVISTTPLDANAIADIREQAQSPLYLSVAAYIAVNKGEIHLRDKEVSPESIALGVSTGMKIQEISADLSEGKIDLPTWAKYLKVALGVGLGITLLATLFILLILLAASSSENSVDIWGPIMTGFNIGMWITVLSSNSSDSRVQEERQNNKLIESYSRAFDKSYVWISKLCAKIKESIKGAQTTNTQQQTEIKESNEETKTSIIEEELTEENIKRPMLA